MRLGRGRFREREKRGGAGSWKEMELTDRPGLSAGERGEREEGGQLGRGPGRRGGGRGRARPKGRKEGKGGGEKEFHFLFFSFFQINFQCIFQLDF